MEQDLFNATGIRQSGFAATARASMLVAAAVAGAMFFAIGTKPAGTQTMPVGVAEPGISYQAVVEDPDAERRVWLREPQPPTF
jgi:hypothetical protein